MEFTNLHVHTTYSFLDGYGTPKQYAERLKELGQDKIGLTDHGSTWAHIPFYFQLKEKGIKAILGCEFYYDIDVEEKNKQRYHLTVIAKNNEGLHNLYKLMTFAYKEGMYYKPRIDNNILFQHQKGLVVLSGCMGDGFPVRHAESDPELTLHWMKIMDRNIDDFYIEVSPFFERQVELESIIKLADQAEIPIAMTSDTHFPAPKDHQAQDIMLSIGMKQDYWSQSRIKLWDHLFLLESERASNLAFKLFKERAMEFIGNTNKIAQVANAGFEPAKFLRYGNTPKESRELFEQWIDDGIKKRFGHNYTADKKDRIEYEKGIIIEKDFVDYFLIISDLVKWAKYTKGMLVGAARGSAAGSLIAYVLDITEVNPLNHGLMFERFIDHYRTDPPDIDIDFPHKRRDEIYYYLEKKYGRDHVALLGTISYFKGKNSIWDIGRIFNLPRKDIESLAKNIIERSSGDSRADYCIEDSISEIEEVATMMDRHSEFKLATKIEGQARQSGIHAAAIIISEDELEKYGSFMPYEDKKLLTIDKKYAEDLNLLKVDALGLKQLTVIESVLNLIGKDNTWLYNIPLDDPKAFKILNDHLFSGIFQFEGAALKAVSKQSYPDNFDSMHEISALARPGTLHSGMTTKYLNRRAFVKKFKRKTMEKPTYIHQSLEEITEETLGIVIYQEQVIKIMREIGKMSWKDTKEIRTLISKSKGVEFFNTFLETFTKGAKENGLNEYEIDDLWNGICTFGSWAFNKSHSVSYGYISYWTLYLKANYPAEFIISTLQEEGDEDSIKLLLKEWLEHFDGKFVLLDPNKSEKTFSLKDGIIYGGFSNIKGIGEKQADKIIEARDKVNSIQQFKKLVGAKNFELLRKFNALPTSFKVEQSDLFAQPINEREPDAKIPYEFAQWADFYPIGDDYDEYYKEKNFKYIRDVDDDTTTVRLIGKIKLINLRSINELTVQKKAEHEKRNYRNADLDKFFNLVIEDDTGTIFAGINRFRYADFKDEIFKAKVGGIIALEGDKLDGFMKVQITKMKVLKYAE